MLRYGIRGSMRRSLRPRTMKFKSPQPDLSGMAEVFNLAGETLRRAEPKPAARPDTGTASLFGPCRRFHPLTSVLYVKIYGEKSVVEDADGNELKIGTLDHHAENVRWAGERAEKVDYDS